MSLSPGDQIGCYEIVALLGAGGMGQVYRARDTKLGRMAAIKVLPDTLVADDERRARFQREAQLLAALSHPNIAAVYGWEESGGTPALVMELVDGRPLAQAIPRKGMPVGEALQCAIQVARGLEAAHRAGIVHRDLKPSNVMMTASGQIKLLDFGLAKLTAVGPAIGEADETMTASHTAEGIVMGTTAYMSPEQAQGLPVDARSDLFSFGVMLFEMLTGERPFRGENQASTLAAILRQEPKPVSSLASTPPELDRLVARCLRKSAERRFQTASDLRVALEELAEEASSGQLVAPHAPAKSRAGWWMAAAAAMVVLAGALYWMRPHGEMAPAALRQLTFESGMALMPALSPDGRMLAYVSDRSGEGALDLWIRQIAGGDPHRLTSGMGTVSNPKFSPDGTRVLFLSGSSIFEVSALGGPARRLVESAGPFTISSRGEIAFLQPTTATRQVAQIVPLEGGEPHEWRSDCKSSAPPAWSPDGQQLAFVGACGQAQGVFVAPRQGGSPMRIAVAAPFDVMNQRLSDTSRLAWDRSPTGASRDGLIATMRNGDSMNLYRIALDGAVTPVTRGTGLESGPAVSASGDMVFTRAEYQPAIWSLPLDAEAGAVPRREAAPAGLFGVSRDGTKMVYGRMAGMSRGELILRDPASGSQTVIATHDLFPGGIGSFWTEISPDASRAIYRMNPQPGDAHIGHCMVTLTGGTPRCSETLARFGLVSGWRADGKRVLGECERGAICEMDPDDWSIRQLVAKPPDEQLLYPSYSWDGKWMTFMQRGGGTTAITMAHVLADGGIAPRNEWVRVSPVEIKAAARPRFTEDGKVLFYIKNESGLQHLMRQPVDLAAGRATGPPVQIALVHIFPAWFADSIGSPTSTVEVSKNRVYFNSVELRGNVWTTSLNERKAN